MNRKHLMSFLSILVLLDGTANAQIRRNNINPAEIGRSLSISYVGGGAPVALVSTLGSNSDAINGTYFSGGRALYYKVRSDKTYSIRVAGENVTGPAMTSSARPIDIRDFIFYDLVENNTGGFPMRNTGDPEGEQLGSKENSIIVNCPPTIDGFTTPEAEAGTRTFGLRFHLRTGYSMPPGSYNTNVLVTATYE